MSQMSLRSRQVTLKLGMRTSPRKRKRDSSLKRFLAVCVCSVCLPVLSFMAVHRLVGVDDGSPQVNRLRASQSQQSQPSSEVPDLDELQRTMKELDVRVRAMKRSGTVMETDPDALDLTSAFQDATRDYLYAKYGKASFPLRLKLTLRLPRRMLHYDGDALESIVIELAPPDLMPHATHVFLEAMEHFRGAKFHRNAGHVMQAFFEKGDYEGGRRRHAGLAWQEYHPSFPHKKYTMGYAGRPGGPDFYVNIVDNVRNHGPGSQGSETEADSCFAKVVDGRDIIDTMANEWGRSGHGFKKDRMGFLKNNDDFVVVEDIKLIKNIV